MVRQGGDSTTELRMIDLELHVASNIEEGTEEVWVTSGTVGAVVVLLIVDLESHALRGFSCRLQTGVVAELGETKDVVSGEGWPSLCIFAEEAGRVASLRYYCSKRGGKWSVEAS